MAREVITDKIARRLSRRLRKESGLKFMRTDGRGVHENIPDTRGRRGTVAKHANFFAIASKMVRSGDVPAPKKSVNGRKPYVKPLVNEFKGMKRKHRLRIRRGVA